jgi:hypothetical protein
MGQPSIVPFSGSGIPGTSLVIEAVADTNPGLSAVHITVPDDGTFSGSFGLVNSSGALYTGRLSLFFEGFAPPQAAPLPGATLCAPITGGRFNCEFLITRGITSAGPLAPGAGGEGGTGGDGTHGSGGTLNPTDQHARAGQPAAVR